MSIPGVSTDIGDAESVPVVIGAGETFTVRANTQVPYLNFPTVDQGGSLVIEQAAIFYAAGQQGGPGGDALTTDPLSQFAATTSSQLAGVISDETGSGALVFATGPTLVTPILGTPTSGNLANCTGYAYGSLTGVPSTFPPSSHTHGNITNAGAIGSTANLPLITTTSGVVTTGTFGTTVNTFCQGNDTRLSDATTAKTRTDTGSITIRIDGGGSAITTGNKLLRLYIPYDCTITGWLLIGDQSGSIVIDLWKNTFANAPATVADTITGSAKPTLSSENKAQSTTLTGWATSLSAGDYLEVNVDSATTVQVVALTLTVSRA
jgi:hypothetical protein